MSALLSDAVKLMNFGGHLGSLCIWWHVQLVIWQFFVSPYLFSVILCLITTQMQRQVPSVALVRYETLSGAFQLAIDANGKN